LYERTGHTAGVTCLGFDQKSLLFAGGFNHTILVWDLDADIDIPLFTLIGHESAIHKIIGLGDIERCVSLDEHGTLRLWNASKTSTADREARQIDLIHNRDDHIYSFEIFQHVHVNFPTFHSIFIAAYGRRQHVYKMVDLERPVSAPLVVLCSTTLLMILTVHVRDIFFWNATSGRLERKLREVVDADGELTCAVMDNRERKLIVGDSLGGIAVYNCITGVVLKHFPTLPFSVRLITYTLDQLVIAVAGVGDIYILDEKLTESSGAMLLRCTSGSGHEADVCTLAYSNMLGMIATADTNGSLSIWNSQYLSLEIVIHDVVGGSVGQVCFLDPWPFLLVTDAINNFTVIPLGPAADRFGKKLWRLDASVGHHHDKDLLHHQQAVDGGSGGENGVVEEDVDDDNEAAEGSLAALAGKKKPLSVARTRNYLLTRRSVKSCAALVKVIGADHSQDDEEANIAKQISRILAERKERYGGDEEHEDDISDDEKTRAEQALKDKESSRLAAAIAAGNHFAKGKHVLIACGHDDGSLTLSDLTAFFKEIDAGELRPDQYARNDKRYDPRKSAKDREITPFNVNRALWTEEQVHTAEAFSTYRLLKVWLGHNGPVTSLSFAGDAPYILTSSADHAVMAWTLEGLERGILTRGKKWDLQFPPYWRCPVNMLKREQARIRRAKIYASLLKLQPRTILPGESGIMLLKSLISGGGGRQGAGMQSVNASRVSTPQLGNNHGDNSKKRGQLTDAGAHSMGSPSPLMSPIMSPKPSRPGSPSQASVRSSSTVNTKSRSVIVDLSGTDRSRVIGQLRGKVTYEMSKKEVAQHSIAEKSLASEQDAMRKARKALKKKDVHKMTPKEIEQRFLDQVMSGFVKDVKKKGPTLGMISHAKERKIATKYDLELAKLDADDPHNWELYSANRQRALYGKLYGELDIAGYTVDKMAVITSKLNALSPGGDFEALAKTIKSQRRVAKKSIEMSSSIDMSLLTDANAVASISSLASKPTSPPTPSRRDPSAIAKTGGTGVGLREDTSTSTVTGVEQAVPFGQHAKYAAPDLKPPRVDAPRPTAYSIGQGSLSISSDGDGDSDGPKLIIEDVAPPRRTRTLSFDPMALVAPTTPSSPGLELPRLVGSPAASRSPSFAHGDGPHSAARKRLSTATTAYSTSSNISASTDALLQLVDPEYDARGFLSKDERIEKATNIRDREKLMKRFERELKATDKNYKRAHTQMKREKRVLRRAAGAARAAEVELAASASAGLLLEPIDPSRILSRNRMSSIAMVNLHVLVFVHG
jgi:WD40 repeat protein